MKKIALSCLLMFVLLLLLPLNCTSAQTRTVGVNAGDTFKYTYTLSYNMTNSSDFSLPSIFDALFEQAQSLEYAKMTILDVTGTNVTGQMVLHFKNGTEQTSVSTTDIENGQGNLTMFLIGSNLNQTDPVYIGQNEQTINETLVRSYPSGSRQLNHQRITTDYNVSEDELADFNLTAGFTQHNTQDIFWDRQLGVLVEMSYNMVTQSSILNADISMQVSLVESNALTIPEFPTYLPVLLVILVSGSVAAIYRRKR